MWLPGVEPAVVTKVTSYSEVIPTLMPLLGVQNAVVDYSLGYSMLDSGLSLFISHHLEPPVSVGHLIGWALGVE